MKSPRLPTPTAEAMLWRSSGTRPRFENDYSRRQPGLFVFLIDQSHAWANQLRCGETTAQNVALTVNNWLQNLVIHCYSFGELADWLHVVVLGYRSDNSGNPVIESALIGPLAGRELLSIGDVSERPGRIDEVAAFFLDEETGGSIEMPQQVPIWIDPVAKGEAPLCGAIARACRIVDDWIPRFPDSFPPIILNFSSGIFSDGNPWPFADALKRRGTRDGPVLFMTTYVSPVVSANAVIFPHAVGSMPDASASMLFACSSYLPPELLDRMRVMGHNLPGQVKCMALNADLIGLMRVLPFPQSEPPWVHRRRR